MDLSDSVFAGPDPNWSRPLPAVPPIRHPWEPEAGYGSEVRPLILPNVPPRGGLGRAGLRGIVGGGGSSLYAPSSVSHVSHELYYEDHLMRPGRLPVLNPEVVQEDHLNLHLNRLSREVHEAVVPDVQSLVDSYVPTQEMVEYFERLDVLLCGKCQSVFHVLEEFKSHKPGCRGESSHGRSGQESSDYALALTLWYNTLIRKIEQAGVPYADQEDLRQHIQSKFYRLSWKSKQKWQKVARHVRKLCSEGQVLFGSVDLRKDLLREYHPPIWVEGENGPSMLELKQEVSTKWSSLGVEEIAKNGSSSTTLPKLSLLRPVRTLVPRVPGPNLVSSSSVPIMDSEPEGKPVVLEILAQRDDQYCVTIKGRQDPKWMDAKDLTSKLINAFRKRSNKPTKSVGVITDPIPKAKTKSVSTMSVVPKMCSIATETLSPKLVSRTTETDSTRFSSVGTETLVTLKSNVGTETIHVQTCSMGTDAQVMQDNEDPVKPDLALIVADNFAGAPEMDEAMLEPSSLNRTLISVMSHDSASATPPPPVNRILPTQSRDPSPDSILKSPPRASRLKALTKLKLWAKDKGVSSSEDSRPSSPMETVLTQGNFTTVMGAFQAEFEKSLSSSNTREEGFKSALMVESPMKKPLGGPAHWWLTKKGSGERETGKQTWGECCGGKVEVIQLGMEGGARTLREELETNDKLWKRKKRGRPKGSTNKTPLGINQQRLKVKLTMGRKRPSKSLSKSFGDTKALDKAKSKESFGLQFSDDDDDDEDDDTDRDDLEFVGRGRKRKRPNDEKPRMVKAKKKRRNHPTDDLADEEIAKIIPKGFTVIPQFSGKGTVEYVVRKARDDGKSSKSSKSISTKTSSNVPPKVLEFGTKKVNTTSANAQEPSNVKTILLNSEQGAKDALQNGSVSRPSPSIIPGPEDKDKNSSQFVKLTYRPTEQDLLLSNQYPRRSNEANHLHHSRHSPNSFEVTSTTDNMDLQEGILDKNQEVSTTTKPSTTTCATTTSVPGAKDVPPTEEDAEYTLDPMSGLLVDKEGNPLQVKEPPQTTTQSLPTFAQLRPALALPDPSVGCSTSASIPFSNVLSQAQMVQVSVPLPLDSQGTAGNLMLHAGQQPSPSGYTGNASEITQSTMSFDPSMQGLQPSFQISEDGGIIMSSMDPTTGALSTDQTNNPVQYATNVQGVPGTSNKVLLVLPGGQMILTDLTDEQCGQLNIQVEQPGDGNTVNGVPQGMPTHHHAPNTGVSADDVANNIQFTFTTDNLTVPMTSQQPVPVLTPTTSSSHTHNPAFLSSAEISDLPITLETLESGKGCEAKIGAKDGDNDRLEKGSKGNSQEMAPPEHDLNQISAGKP